MSTRKETGADFEVRVARSTARKMLDQYGPADIYDHGALALAHGALTASLERLLAALDVQAAQGGDR